jgi:hypothetical protein
MEMTTTETAKDIRSEARKKLPDFILAEYVHLNESLLRNEESGEKRAAFFVTLVGATVGILGFVFGEKTSFASQDKIFPATAIVAAILLCLGFLTVRRLIQRDLVTEEIKLSLRTLRRLFLTKKEAEGLPNSFFAPYAKPKRRSVKVFSIGNGGWLQTVAFVNALLMGVFVVTACLTVSRDEVRPWQIILALAGCVIVWIVQLTYAKSTVSDTKNN